MGPMLGDLQRAQASARRALHPALQEAVVLCIAMPHAAAAGGPRASPRICRADSSNGTTPHACASPTTPPWPPSLPTHSSEGLPADMEEVSVVWERNNKLSVTQAEPVSAAGSARFKEVMRQSATMYRQVG